MIAMGVLAIVLAVTGPGMPSGGWQTELSGWLQHLSASTLHALSWLPGWVVIAVLAAVFAILIGRALPTCIEPAAGRRRYRLSTSRRRPRRNGNDQVSHRKQPRQ